MENFNVTENLARFRTEKANHRSDEFHEKDVLLNIQNNALSLRKKRLMNRFMMKRKERNFTKNSLYEFNLTEIESLIPREIVFRFAECCTPQERVKAIMETFRSNDNNILIYCIFQLRFISREIEKLPPNELIIFCMKFFCNEYQDKQYQFKLQSTLLSIFINFAAVEDDEHISGIFFEDVFLSNVFKILKENYPKELKTDALWLLNNLIRSKFILYHMMKKINLIKEIENYLLLVSDECLVCLMLIRNIIERAIQTETKLSEEQGEELFKMLNFQPIFDKLITLFFLNYNDLILNVNKSVIQSNFNAFMIEKLNKSYKMVKKTLLVLFKFLELDDGYVLSFLRNEKFLKTLRDYVIQFLPPDKDEERRSIDLGEGVKMEREPKERKLIIKQNQKILSLVTQIVNNCLYYSKGEVFDKIASYEFLYAYTSLLEKFLLLDKLLSKNILSNICNIVLNYISESIKYAREIFSHEISLIKYLCEFSKKIYDISYKVLFIELMHNAIALKDKEIMKTVLRELKLVELLCKWLLEINDSELIQSILGLLKAIFCCSTFYEERKYLESIKQVMNKNNIPEVLNQLSFSEKIQIAEDAVDILQNWSMEDIMVLKTDFNGSNSPSEENDEI